MYLRLVACVVIIQFLKYRGGLSIIIRQHRPVAVVVVPRDGKLRADVSLSCRFAIPLERLCFVLWYAGAMVVADSLGRTDVESSTLHRWNNTQSKHVCLAQLKI